MGETTENRQGSLAKAEKHWLYHPMLDGYGPAVQDPLVEKARRLRETGATIITDTIREEGMGVVHVLEWIELKPNGWTTCNRSSAGDL